MIPIIIGLEYLEGRGGARDKKDSLLGYSGNHAP
jgi:hypothetical protein